MVRDRETGARADRANSSNFSHKSIVAYLSANNLPNAVAALRTELGLEEETFDAVTAKKYETLLEKKWTSVIRLQKKASYFSVPTSYLLSFVSCLLLCTCNVI